MQQQLVTNPNPPQAPSFDGSSYSTVVASVKSLFNWAAQFAGYYNAYTTQSSQIINTATSGFGASLPSAVTIKITNALHHVTGSASISTIHVPPNFSGGPVWLVNNGSWMLITGGNIARAYTPSSEQCVCLVYAPVKKLFYPTV